MHTPEVAGGGGHHLETCPLQSRSNRLGPDGDVTGLQPQPLVTGGVNPRGGHRLFQRHTVVDDVADDLHNRGDDPVVACTPHRQQGSVVRAEQDGGRNRGGGAATRGASLGTLIRVGNNFLFSGEWWITLFPAMSLEILVLAVNLLGDWLRDALNPKLR